MTRHRPRAPRRRNARQELAHIDRTDLTPDERLAQAQQLGTQEADRIAELVAAAVLRIAQHEAAPLALTVARLGSYPGALAVIDAIPLGLRAAADDFERASQATKAQLETVARNANQVRRPHDPH